MNWNDILKAMTVEQAESRVKEFERRVADALARQTAFQDKGEFNSKVIEPYHETWEPCCKYLDAQLCCEQSQLKFWRVAKELIMAERTLVIDESEEQQSNLHLRLRIYANFIEVHIQRDGKDVPSADVTARFLPAGSEIKATCQTNCVYRIEESVPTGSSVAVTAKRVSQQDGFICCHTHKRQQTNEGERIERLRHSLSLAAQEVEARNKQLEGARQELDRVARNYESQARSRRKPVPAQHAPSQPRPDSRESDEKQQALNKLQEMSTTIEKQQALNTLKTNSIQLPTVVIQSDWLDQANREADRNLPDFLKNFKSQRHVFAKEVTLERIRTFPSNESDLVFWAVHNLAERQARQATGQAFAEWAEFFLKEAVGAVTGRRAFSWAKGTYDTVEKAFDTLAQMEDVGFFSCEFPDSGNCDDACYILRFTTLYCPWAKMQGSKWFGEAVTVVRADPGSSTSATATVKSPRFLDLIEALKRGSLCRTFWYPVNLPWEWMDR
jgi:hypothetical protein